MLNIIVDFVCKSKYVNVYVAWIHETCEYIYVVGDKYQYVNITK